MKRFFLLTILLVVMFLIYSPDTLLSRWPEACPTHDCTERLVTTSDDDEDGSLREVLRHSCEDNGDDAIQFGIASRIVLKSPLSIPENCNGAIHIFGREGGRNLIDGSHVSVGTIVKGSCLLRVETDNNTISRLNIVGFRQSDKEKKRRIPGTGLCILGDNNRVIDSTFGVVDAGNSDGGNDVGLWIAGNENRIEDNHVSQNRLDGIQITGHQNIIKDNYLGYPLQNCSFEEVPDERIRREEEPETATEQTTQELRPSSESSDSENLGDSLPVDPFPAAGHGGCQMLPEQRIVQPVSSGCPQVTNWRHGIHLMDQAHDNTIIDNIFQFNGGSAIRLSGSSESVLNLLSPNQFSNNKKMAIDLGDAGPDEDDVDDLDQGTNTLLNRPELILFQVRNRFGSESNKRFVLHGKAAAGQMVDLYIADTSEPDGFAEGFRRLRRISVSENSGTFAEDLTDEVSSNSVIVAVTLDSGNNTSEFSPLLLTKQDTDLDGIPDVVEDKNGNGIVDTGETDPYRADTDGDGLPDASEDRNRSGDRNGNETEGHFADSDEDGLSDFVEVFGPSDPLRVDTDCDGLSDAVEDGDQNGIIMWSLSETFPHIADTDGDGVSDGPMNDCNVPVTPDNCPLVNNPSQADGDGDGFGDECDLAP